MALPTFFTSTLMMKARALLSPFTSFLDTHMHTHTISSKIYLLFLTSSSDTTSFTSTFDLSRAFDMQLWKKRERKLPEVQFQVTVKAKKVSHSSCLASRFHPDSAKREVWGRDLFIPWLLLMGYSWESYSSWAVDLQASHIAELPILCQPLRANDGASQQFLSWAELPIEKNANQKVSFYTAITGNFFTTKSGSFSAIIIQFPSVSSVVWSIYRKETRDDEQKTQILIRSVKQIYTCFFFLIILKYIIND